MMRRAGRIVMAALVPLTVLAAAAAVRPGSARAFAPTPVLARTVIGYSVQHRPIVAYHLGDPTLKRSSLLIGEMHGDEHAGVIVAKSIIQGRLSVQGVNLWVVPTMNPDGDAAHTRQNAHKVDLNRNWPYKWRHLSGMYYSGTRPLSEPESTAVYHFLRKYKPQYVVSLHQPLNGVDTSAGNAKERAFARTLARNLGLPSTQLRCWSACYGSMTDWYDARNVGIAETVEFGWHPSRAYLVGRARRGIIAAVHGTFGSLARHNPRYRITVTAARTGRQVSFTGWAYDIDNRAAALSYKIYDGVRLIATGKAGPSAAHRVSKTLTATPGRHRYCTVLVNVGAGTRNPRACTTATVPA